MDYTSALYAKRLHEEAPWIIVTEEEQKEIDEALKEEEDFYTGEEFSSGNVKN